MEVADLVLPVFAVIVTGWLAGWLGHISRSLADGLVHFAYNVAMPALLFVTVAQEPSGGWHFGAFKKPQRSIGHGHLNAVGNSEHQVRASHWSLLGTRMVPFVGSA